MKNLRGVRDIKTPRKLGMRVLPKRRGGSKLTELEAMRLIQERERLLRLRDDWLLKIRNIELRLTEIDETEAPKRTSEPAPGEMVSCEPKSAPAKTGGRKKTGDSQTVIRY